ncbi:MAG: DUF3048 domain-containing protein [Solobacterium sp.]|nr:DUF3048 domain-containing protein [Solobacterium sp.]
MNYTKLMRTALAASMLLGIAGCQSKKTAPSSVASVEEEEVVVTEEPVETETAEEEIEERTAPPEGTYFSELTGEPIDEKLKDQRPLAVSVDNEILAYPHFGVATYGDIVYEMVNSQENGRITRMMVMVKDWENIDQMGSIRSTRDTNVILQGEWNSILCHDGSSDTAVPYFSRDYARDHFSATFSRVKNGKAWEFTEYIMPGDLDKNFEMLGCSRTYTSLKPDVDSHYNFVDYASETMTDESLDKAVRVDLPFPHNKTYLLFNEGTQTYDYYCYGKLHQDGQNDKVLSFENLLVLNIPMSVIDEKAHVLYDVIGEGNGYYMSRGHMIPITWKKTSDYDITRYYDENGDEIEMNRGKIYIGFVPSDSWDQLIINKTEETAEPEESETEESDTEN